MKEKFTYYTKETTIEYNIIRKYESGFEESVVTINKTSYQNKELAIKIKDSTLYDLNKANK